MLGLFDGLRGMLKRNPVTIDDGVFRLHWTVTAAMLIAFSLVITARQYVGNPIQCLKMEHIPSEYLDLYCLTHGTYLVSDALTKEVGTEVPHPGIDNSKSGDRKYYTYYQWVYCSLFLQGMFFYLPYYLWSIFEGDLIKSVSLGMKIAVISKEERSQKKKMITDYLISHRGCNRYYTFMYIFCKVLCFLNVIVQMVLMNFLFNGDYKWYGINVVRYALNNTSFTVDPMTYVFPTITKCNFRDFGPSGDVQSKDVICQLPLNVMNKVFYLFMWYWFIVLGILSVLEILEWLLIIVLPFVRRRLLELRCRLALKDHINSVVKRIDVADWFVLYMVGKNLDAIVFSDVMCEMARGLERDRAIELEKVESMV